MRVWISPGRSAFRWSALSSSPPACKVRLCYGALSRSKRSLASGTHASSSPIKAPIQRSEISRVRKQKKTSSYHESRGRMIMNSLESQDAATKQVERQWLNSMLFSFHYDDCFRAVFVSTFCFVPSYLQPLRPHNPICIIPNIPVRTTFFWLAIYATPPPPPIYATSPPC